jgi:ribonuclease HI
MQESLPGLGPAATATAGERYDLYADGACRGNPGPGGWGVLLRSSAGERELCGGEPDTTNNRMELMAVIQGLNALPPGSTVKVLTDSQYVQKGISEWIHGWKKRGWLTAERKPVKNAELWRALEAAAIGHRVEWTWVRGHAGNEGNERADRLANRGIDAA